MSLIVSNSKSKFSTSKIDYEKIWFFINKSNPLIKVMALAFLFYLTNTATNQIVDTLIEENKETINSLIKLDEKGDILKDLEKSNEIISKYWFENNFEKFSQDIEDWKIKISTEDMEVLIWIHKKYSWKKIHSNYLFYFIVFIWNIINIVWTMWISYWYWKYQIREEEKDTLYNPNVNQKYISEFNKYRSLLWLWSYEDFKKMYYLLLKNSEYSKISKIWDDSFFMNEWENLWVKYSPDYQKSKIKTKKYNLWLNDLVYLLEQEWYNIKNMLINDEVS